MLTIPASGKPPAGTRRGEKHIHFRLLFGDAKQLKVLVRGVFAAHHGLRPAEQEPLAYERRQPVLAGHSCLRLHQELQPSIAVEAGGVELAEFNAEPAASPSECRQLGDNPELDDVFKVHSYPVTGATAQRIRLLPPLGLCAQRRHIPRGIDMELPSIDGPNKGSTFVGVQTSRPMSQCSSGDICAARAKADCPCAEQRVRPFDRVRHFNWLVGSGFGGCYRQPSLVHYLVMPARLVHRRIVAADGEVAVPRAR
jgi:hypothetical protein